MADVKKMSTDEITARARLLNNEIRIMRADIMRIQHEMQTQKDKIKENTEKIKVNKTLPYLVSNVIEILDVDPEELGIEEDGANVDLDSQRKGKYQTQFCTVFMFYKSCNKMSRRKMCRHKNINEANLFSTYHWPG